MSEYAVGTECVTCWQLYFAVTNTTINVTLVYPSLDLDGLVISEEAMNTLTGGLAFDLGMVEVTATQAGGSVCGLTAIIP